MSKQPEPDYHCPKCGTLSTLIVGPTQAFCTNEQDCNVINFDPSLPDGGLSQAQHVDFTGQYREQP